MTESDRERQRETERNRERQRETERDRERQRETERQRDRQRDTERYRERERERERERPSLNVEPKPIEIRNLESYYKYPHNFSLSPTIKLMDVCIRKYF